MTEPATLETPSAQPSPSSSPKGKGGKSGGYWRNVWRRFSRNRRGVVGLAFVASLLLVAFLSPLVASGQPIICKYEGKIYFPAIVEVFQSRGVGDHWLEKSAPFRLPQFDAKTAEFDWAVWPLI